LRAKPGKPFRQIRNLAQVAGLSPSLDEATERGLILGIAVDGPPALFGANGVTIFMVGGSSSISGREIGQS
jgi:hypothetical protein